MMKVIAIFEDSLNQRRAEAWSKVNASGERARAFVIRAWSTTDGNRIERLIDENLVAWRTATLCAQGGRCAELRRADPGEAVRELMPRGGRNNRYCAGDCWA
jgi:hypothetical protein